MHCRKEEEFNQQYESLIQVYVHEPSICRYITIGWCGSICRWRTLWPKFGRLFNYGYVGTTNIVERHWKYIKYTALRERINRSITDLVHALIGDSVTGSWFRGTIWNGLSKNKKYVSLKDSYLLQIAKIKQLDCLGQKGYLRGMLEIQIQSKLWMRHDYFLKC